MSIDTLASLAQWVSVDSPALPSPWVMQGWLHLGWSVVLAWGVTVLGPAWPPRVRWVGAGLAALWSWVPGPYSPTYWLGLAFQAPSISSVLLGAWLLHDRLRAPREAPSVTVHSGKRSVGVFAVLGILAGWALLLDAFALLPVPLYAWGFSPIAPALGLLVALLPWGLGCRQDSRVWIAPTAVLLFVVLRLPTGNAWAAMLDPWLWVLLQGYGVRAAFRRAIRLKSAP